MFDHLRFVIALCLVCAGCVVVSVASAVSATSGLHQTGTLTPTLALGNGQLGGVVVSGSTLAVGSTMGVNDDEWGVVVFRKGTDGWSHASDVGELVATEGAAVDELGVGGGVAISGRTIVAASPLEPPLVAAQGAVYVFEQPAGGWSGIVHQSAQLEPPRSAACTSTGPEEISGNVVAVGCWTDRPAAPTPGAVFVFTKPVHGWSGIVRPSARLVPSHHRTLTGGGPLAFSGQTVFAAGPGGIYGFREPARGWTGTIHSVATIKPPSPWEMDGLTVSGRTLYAAAQASATKRGGQAAVYAFSEPHRGWSGIMRRYATLRYTSSQFNSGPSIAATGSTLSLSTTNTYLGRGIYEHGCPCTTILDVFRAPRARWRGSFYPVASRSIVTPSVPAVAAAASTLFATDGNVVSLFSLKTGSRPRH